MSSLSRNRKQSIVATMLMGAAAIYALVGIAHPPEGITITNETISSFLFKTGQRMVERSSMTETVVQSTSLATILELNLSVTAMVGNGRDSCRVVATVLDASGNPIPDGQPVEFVTTAGTFSNGNDTTYALTVNGNAVTWLTSELLVTSQPVTACITVSTLGASGQSLTRFTPILSYAGGVRGKIVSGERRSVQAMIVVAYTPTHEEAGRDTTADNGEFLIPLTRSDVYTIEFRYRNAFGDEIAVHAITPVTVPASGGVEAAVPLNTIVGNAMDIATGSAIRKAQLPVMLYGTSTNPASEGRLLPAMGTTDERGVFAFDSLAAGTYEVLVIDVRYSGKSAMQQSDRGTFLIDANIQLADSPLLEVIKTSNKRIAEIGDAVTYTVEVRNISASSPLVNVQLIDELPHAFVFAQNSARRDSIPLPNPDNGRKLEWALADSLSPGRSIRVSYTAFVGSGALDGDGVNRAMALATNSSGQTVQSLQASQQVTIRPGIFTDRGLVIGKVFYDENENAEQDEGESGIHGVELWMEDGSRIITGDDGKYSLPEVRAGQHVMRVNTLTLPYGVELLALKSESAEDGLTRFVRLTEGGIARTDFYVRRPNQASAEVTYAEMEATGIGQRIPAFYVIRFGEIGTPTRILLADTLPAGLMYDYKSISWNGTPLYPDGVASPVLSIDFPGRNPNSSDTIHFTIVTDSAANGKALASQGKLLLAYPRGRDASFGIAQAYKPVVSPRTEPIVSVEPKQTQEVEDTTRSPVPSGHVGTEPRIIDTVKARGPAEEKPVPDQPPRRLMATARKSPAKKSSLPRISRVDSVKLPAPDSTTTVEQPAVAPPATKKRPRIAELLGYDEGKRLYEQKELFVRAGGLIASAVLLYLLLIFLWKRRKNRAETRQ